VKFSNYEDVQGSAPGYAHRCFRAAQPRTLDDLQAIIEDIRTKSVAAL